MNTTARKLAYKLFLGLMTVMLMMAMLPMQKAAAATVTRTGASSTKWNTASIANTYDQAPQTDQNVTADISISGNAGAGGVTLSYTDGTSKTVTTDDSGNYSFTELYNWSGTVTPSRAGVTFSPASRTYTNVTAAKTGQNFKIGISILGNAGVASAILSYTDVTLKTTYADASGNYSLTVPYNWSGTVSPSKTGATFSPVSLTNTNVQSAQTGQNFTALVTISGNAGAGGVTLSYTDGTAKKVTTDDSGNYSFTEPYNWSGTVTPFRAGFTFLPTSRTYANVK